MRILGLMAVMLLSFINWAQADNAVDLNQVIVEASRSNDTVDDMNKNVTIITAEDIANSPAKSLPELLGTVPGVDARVDSNIKDSQVNMGGFGESSSSNVLILVDGRRLNTPDLAGPDLSLINLNSIDHIEIIQGAGTVLYGDNATGGVINIVTKKGQENTKPSVTLTSQTGSYKTNDEGLDLSGGLSKLGYQFDYDHQQSNNYRTQDNYWGDDYDTRLNYNPTDIFGIDLTQGYHLDRYRLPGGISIDQINSGGPTGVDSSRIGYGSTSDSHFDLTPHMKFDEGSSNIDLSLFTSARKSDTNFAYTNSGYAVNYETESYEFEPKLILSTPLTDRLGNKLTSGYDYIYYTEKRRINYPGSLEDIVYASEASQGVYLLDEMTLDEHWLLNAGARGAWAGYVLDQTQQTAIKFDRSPTTEGYDGGLGYKYNPNSKVFVEYTRSYRLPNLDEFFQNPFPGGSGADTPELFNSGLTYQTGNQYQLGIKDQSFKNVNLGFTATEVQYKNEIYDDPVTFLNSNYNGRTRHYSEEADASVDLFNKKFEPFANITFQQSEFISGEFSGSQIPDVPDHLAHAGIIYRPLKGLSTTVSADFVGKRFTIGDDANTLPKVKRYDTYDWSAKYDYNNMEVWVSLNNIFNSHYFVYGSGYGTPEIFYTAPGRNVEAGVKVKF